MRIIGFLIGIIILLAISVPGQAQTDEEVTLDLIGRLNEWRISQGVWPLKANDTLTALAQAQAQYVASLPELPQDLHADAKGLNPRERALLDPFNWPHYELPTQIAIGENAALGTVDYALKFWHESSIHSKTALNPAYREVGVAALPYRNTYLFFAVFGARPDVLPALTDPQDGRTVYLSEEKYEYAQFNESIQSTTTIQIFDNAGRPLYDTPVEWTEKVVVPEEAGDTVYILSSDGERDVLSAVNLGEDQVILTDEGVEVASGETSSETVAQPTAVPTATPMPQVEEQVTESQNTASPDMLVYYSNDTLNVLNVSGGAIDWRGLEFSGSITFPFEQWSRVTEFPLDALPNRHCLQIRSSSVTGDVVKLDDCGWVRSLIQLGTDRLFWAQGPFDVKRDGVTLATCQPDVSVCAVPLN